MTHRTAPVVTRQALHTNRLIARAILTEGVRPEIVDVATELLRIFRCDREVTLAIEILPLFPELPFLEGGDVVGIVVHRSHLRLHRWLEVDGETWIAVLVVIPEILTLSALETRGWIGNGLTILHEEEIDRRLWRVTPMCLHMNQVAETVHQHTTYIFLIHDDAILAGKRLRGQLLVIAMAGIGVETTALIETWIPVHQLL